MKASNISKLTVLTALTLLLTALSIGFEGGDGTSSSPYEIATCEQLQDMQSDTSADYVLVDDVDCTNQDNFDEITGFSGVLNGDGHRIKNLTVDEDGCDTCGLLLGYPEDGAVVKDLALIEPYALLGGDDDGSGIMQGGPGAVTYEGIYLEQPYMRVDENAAFFGGYYQDLKVKESAVRDGVIETRNTHSSNDDKACFIYRGGDDSKVVDSQCDITIEGPDGSDTAEVDGIATSTDLIEGVVISAQISAYNGEDLVTRGCDATINNVYADTESSNVGTDCEISELNSSESTGDAAEGNMGALDFEQTWDTVQDGYPVPKRVSHFLETDLSICDRRGPIQECVSNSSHSVSGEEFTLENIFEAESTAVFQAFDQKASISVSNSTRISGLWEGSFDVQSDDRTRLGAGARFDPGDGRITIN